MSPNPERTMSDPDARRIEGGRGIVDVEFERSDDVFAHEKRIELALERARALEEAYRTKGDLTPAERAELPRVAARLRRLFELQMGPTVADLNRNNPADDEIPTDHSLRIHLRRIRNLHIDMNKAWSTRTVRKVHMWIKEDIPNWFSVTWRSLKDNTKYLLKGAGVAALAGTGLAVGGYALTGALMSEVGWGAGALAGLRTLGQHAGATGSAIGDMFRRDQPLAPQGGVA